MTKSLRFQKSLFYVSIFFNGVAVLLIEILGTRLLAPFYGTTIYVWSSLITVTLLSLSLGYWWGGVQADRKSVMAAFYSRIFLAGILTSLFLQYRGSALIFSERFGAQFGPLTASLILFAPTLTVLGMITPYAVRLLSKDLAGVGRNSGLVFALATIGSLVGSLLAGFVLLPLFSLTAIFYSTAGLLAAIGLVGYILETNIWQLSKKNLRFAIVVFLLFLLGIVLSSINQKIVAGYKNIKTSDVLFSRQNFYGMNRVAAVPKVGGKICFIIDAGIQTCIDPNNKDFVGYTGKLGIFLSLLSPDSKVLVLGFGGGKLIREWDRPDVSFDLVDINGVAFEAAEKFLGVKFQERHQQIVDDARGFLRRTDQSYDAILVDLANQFLPPPHVLSLEFFKLADSKLKPNGFVVYHVVSTRHSGEAGQGLEAILATMRQAFEYIWSSKDGVSNLIVLSSQGQDELMRKTNEEIRKVQATYRAEDVFNEFSRLSHFNQTAPVLTDQYNPIEFLWRNEFDLFLRFRVLLKEDLI